MSNTNNLERDNHRESNCVDAFQIAKESVIPVAKQVEITTKLVLSLTLDEDEQDFEKQFTRDWVHTKRIDKTEGVDEEIVALDNFLLQN